jgi:mannitol-1-/sugar-/sorbitol-6-phosphatase
VTLICKAVLFDLDGVLVDSTPAVARVWARWAREQGLAPEKVIAHAHGRRSIETVRAFAPNLNAEQENGRVEQMEIHDKAGVIALPGAARLLGRLPQNRFAIVTSATRPLAMARMQYAGLPVPEHLISADDVLHGKPSPEPYLKGAQLLAFPATDCLVFEDVPAGITSARTAGMQVIAIPNTYPEKELAGATALVRSLELIDVQMLEDSIQIIGRPSDEQKPCQ